MHFIITCAMAWQKFHNPKILIFHPTCSQTLWSRK